MGYTFTKKVPLQYGFAFCSVSAGVSSIWAPVCPADCLSRGSGVKGVGDQTGRCADWPELRPPAALIDVSNFTLPLSSFT
ncbi:hypothetical protein ACOMHN_064206 [Nucella lapillus]